MREECHIGNSGGGAAGRRFAAVRLTLVVGSVTGDLLSARQRTGSQRVISWRPQNRHGRD